LLFQALSEIKFKKAKACPAYFSRLFH